MALAILVELLVVLLVLAFAAPEFVRMEEPEVASFSLTPEPPAPDAEPDAERRESESAAPAAEPEEAIEEPRPEEPAEQPPPRIDFPNHIPLTRRELATADISRPPPPSPTPAPAPRRKSPIGPVDTGPPAGGAYADTPRVSGSGPNGEPLYAARWYREPLDGELSGYLSTASGPGWAMINCRTVVGFRVEDCVLEAESPRGSNIGRSVLAAAWQFRVRPPQLGGTPRFGEWVRIRISYELRGFSVD